MEVVRLPYPEARGPRSLAGPQEFHSKASLHVYSHVGPWSLVLLRARGYGEPVFLCVGRACPEDTHACCDGRGCSPTMVLPYLVSYSSYRCRPDLRVLDASGIGIDRPIGGDSGPGEK